MTGLKETAVMDDNVCECPLCLIADYPHGLDFLMWRTELGWPTVLDADLK